MAVNKVSYGGTTLIDLTLDTLTSASQLAQGVVAHTKSGSTITGTLSGGGSLPSGISAFDYGTFNITSAFTTTRQTFSHKLGVTPDLVMVWAPQNVNQTYSMLAAIRANEFAWRSGYSAHFAYHGNNSSNVTWTYSNSTTYGVSNLTATSFQLASNSSSYYWRAGTYKYIALKFS